MRTRFVEVTQGVERGFNHGKFMVGVFEPEEWERLSALDHAAGFGYTRLLGRCGWSAAHVLVLDLQTGEGSIFRPGGMPSADLDKHRVWVCPMFEPFLAWLYAFVKQPRSARCLCQDAPKVVRDLSPNRCETCGGTGEMPSATAWLDELPALVELPDAPAAQFGYRRPGRMPEPELRVRADFATDPTLPHFDGGVET